MKWFTGFEGNSKSSDEEDTAKVAEEEAERHSQHQQWLERERIAQFQFKQKKEKEALEIQKRLEQEVNKKKDHLNKYVVRGTTCC